MKKFLKKHQSFLFVLFLLLISCNESTEKKAPDNSTADSVAANSPVPEAKSLITGKLDTLWMTMTEFKALPTNKAVFSFTFGNADTLTMHGWSFKGPLSSREYDDPPNIKLLKGKASTINYGPGTYFGSLVLKEINAIKRELRNGEAQYVLFAPEKDGEHIRYKIFGSKEEPFAVVKLLAVIPTSGIANPSPPKDR